MSSKMRSIAGIVYGLLAIFELFSMRYILSNASMSDVPIAWIVEMGIMLGAGVMAVWMLGGDAAVKFGARRGVVVGTTLLVVFELVTYTSQVGAISYALTMLFPNLMAGGSTIYQLIAMIIRLLLMILAAFFVQSASAEMDLEKAAEDVEDAVAEELESAEQGLSEELESAAQELSEELGDVPANEVKEEK